MPAENLRSTTNDWTVVRTFQPAPLELDGRDVPRGFGVLQGTHAEFKNPLTQLPVGRRGLVEINVQRKNLPENVAAERLAYLVVYRADPRRGDASSRRRSAADSSDSRSRPGQITFYVGNRRSVDAIRYEIRGYVPGSYRAAPTVVRNAYRPEQIAVGTAKSLAVLPSGAKSVRPLSPDARGAFRARQALFPTARLAGGRRAPEPIC